MFPDSQLLLNGQGDQVREAFAVSSAAKLKPYLKWEDLATGTHALIIPWLISAIHFTLVPWKTIQSGLQHEVAHLLADMNHDEHIAPIL